MKRLHDLMGFGLVSAFIAACLNFDELGLFIFFAFGISWGRMLMEASRSMTFTKD